MNPLARVKRAVKSAGNLKLLEQSRCPRRHVVLIDRTGRHQRLISVPERRGIEHPVDVRMRAVSRLRKRNLAGASSVRPVAHKLPQPQPRQTVLPLAGDEEPREEIDVFQHHRVAVRNQLGPVLAAWRGHGRGHQPKVASAIVGPDKPQPIAVVDRVLMLILARRNQREVPSRLVRSQHPRLAGRMAGRLHDDVLAVSGPTRRQVESFIVVLIDQHVVRVRRAKHVPPQLELPLLLLVLNGVKKRAIVRRPDHRPHALDLAWQASRRFQDP